MNTVADYTEAHVDNVRKRIEAYRNYNAPQPSFRQLNMTQENRFVKLGYAHTLSPDRPDIKEFFTLQDGAQAAIVVGLVPDRKPSTKTI